MKDTIQHAINAIAQRSGTSIIGLSYDHPQRGMTEYNLRVNDATVQPVPDGATVDTSVSHIAGTGNTLLRAVDHNGGEVPKMFIKDRIYGIRCGVIQA